MGRRGGMTQSDQDDLRQDILLALLSRADRYDSRRGAQSTYIKFVVQNAVVDRIRAARSHLLLINANAAVPDIAAPIDPEQHLILRIDLARALASLAPPLLRVVTLIAQLGSPAEAHRASAMPLCTFYRHLAELRMQLRAAGLAPTP